MVNNSSEARNNGHENGHELHLDGEGLLLGDGTGDNFIVASAVANK